MEKSILLYLFRIRASHKLSKRQATEIEYFIRDQTRRKRDRGRRTKERERDEHLNSICFFILKHDYVNAFPFSFGLYMVRFYFIVVK